MTINFNQIPSNLRTPFTAVEFDSSKAQQGPALLAYKALLIGQKLNSGSAAQDSIVKCTSVDNAIALAGRGSILHRMALGWFASNKSTEMWLGVLADNGAGVAAQGTLTVTGPATASGTLALYLGGERITVAITSGDVQNTIATNIAAAINAALDLPITAAVTTNVVTWSFRHKGTVGQGYDVRYNFRDGDALPAGVSIAIAATTAGITNPTLTNLIAAMSDIWFEIWAHPYTDATSLTAIETELATRSGPMVQQQGVAITAAYGSFSTLTTLGAGRNSQNSSIFTQTGQVPLTPTMEFAAETAAIIAAAAAADPARPFQTLAYSRAIACAETDKWAQSERNLMLFSGISTTKFVTGGGVQIERAITTYETSASGASDTAYLDVNTLFTLMYLRYSWRTRWQNKYPRHKLADDGTPYGSGQAVMTPKLGKAEAVSWFDDMLALGLVQNAAQFKRDLVCERDLTDRTRLNFLLPPNLMNQLIVNATQIQFLI